MKCPKCKTVNPPTKWTIGDANDYEVCKKVVGFKFLLWGWWVKPIYCNFIGRMWGVVGDFVDWQASNHEHIK